MKFIGYFLIVLIGYILFAVDLFDIVSFAVNVAIKINYYLSDDSVLPPLSKYDFIIVGGGTAGCVLANRLSANPKWNVLLLEAGPEETLLMDIPALTHTYQLSDVINWQFKTEPSADTYCLSMENNQCKFPRGKVMGGSSTINYMIYTRGNRRDFDRWAELGNPGWSFKDVELIFRRIENNTITGSYGGPLTVSMVKHNTDAGKAFVTGHIELGLPQNNYNGPKQAGVSKLHTTIKDGLRVSSNRAYIDPIRTRTNLHIKTKSFVTKILFDSKRAIGVQYSAHGNTFSVTASKEVILSAGAIQSPQILMLSGIGRANHLREHGINVVSDLSGVGQNLMDHVTPGYIHFTTNVTTPIEEGKQIQNFVQYIRDGSGVWGCPSACESIAFFDSLNFTSIDGYPDLEILLIAGGISDFNALKDMGALRPDVPKLLYDATKHRGSISLPLFVLRPKSRGHIELKSFDPFVHPAIYANYFTHPYDLEASIRGIRVVHKLAKTEAFKKINATLVEFKVPHCRHIEYDTDAFWECHARQLSLTFFHYTGTCKMGPANDSEAVVDARLRVRGVTNLRVADGSIMPEIVSGHPNAAIFMIGEKAASMIIEDWS